MAAVIGSRGLSVGSRRPNLSIAIPPTTDPLIGSQGLSVASKRPKLSIAIPLLSDPLPLPSCRPLPLPQAIDGVVALSDLNRICLLGAGSSGRVYKVIHRWTGREYALKTLQVDEGDVVVRNQVQMEMDILRQAKSRHLVECYGIFDIEGDVSFLLEYMDGGSLADVLKLHKKIPEQHLAKIAKQVLLGLDYLQHHKIVHRDIKPANLLLNRKGEVKIADFGVSTILGEGEEDQCNSFIGSCAYMSPERLDPDGGCGGKGYGYAADIWSLGITLLECAIGRMPYLQPGEEPDFPTVLFAICMGDSPSPPVDASSEFHNFIVLCLQKDASRRPSAETLLKHPFVTGILKHPYVDE